MIREPDLFDICARKHGGNRQSVAANRITDKTRDRGRILEYLAGVKDSTCDEAVVALGINYQTCSGRFAELKKDGLIVESGARRPTRTGCMAQAFKLQQAPAPSEI